uniref:Apple domain-containing protein n=1 Tax=Rhizochromulina marina TaxID=1034831 RepID=A0A7S2S0A4_9STRA|mmetsp:Transcript_23433/g.68451  ORF Transcript_23433/g.68451 Transcript_23433/m.68451 type:complete len:185 (+) Transcript_23433:13-567(+)
MATRRAGVLAGLLALVHGADVDFACYTGSSQYERVPKICNGKIGNPTAIDNSTTDAWFCSVLKVEEQGINGKRDPVFVWSCATQMQCRANCTNLGQAVPTCSGWYDGDEVSTAGGVSVKAWCSPALNNAKGDDKKAWPRGDPFPEALTLDLDFRDLDDPSAAGHVRPMWVLMALIVSLLGALLL